MKVDTAPAGKTAGVGIATSSSSCVRITGAMDLYGTLINGIYEATSEMSEDMPVYVKVGGSDVRIEYSAPTKQWWVKSNENKGKDGGMAFCIVPAKCLLHECPAGKWIVWAGSKYVQLPVFTVSLVSKVEADAREEVKREAARVVIGRHNVRITGATGVNDGLINGEYKPTSEMSGNVTVYVKEGNNGDKMCLKYNSFMNSWIVQTGVNIPPKAYCTVPAKCLPQECPVGQWYVWEGSKSISQSSVTVSLSRDDGDAADDEAKPTAAAAKVDCDAALKTTGVNAPTPAPAASSIVRIAGAMGPNGPYINDVYQATSEMLGEMPVYVKVGNTMMCMEYSASLKAWQVKNTAYKGEDNALAYCFSDGKCLPEDCPAGQWYVVNDGPKHELQPTVTISLASKEEVDACREELDREWAREVKGRHNVRITGATGTKAGLINGVYKPTNKMRENATVYQKVVGNKVWLRYDTDIKSWIVWEVEDIGLHGILAQCAIPVKGLPQECSAGKWYVLVGNKWSKQSAIKIRRHS